MNNLKQTKELNQFLTNLTTEAGIYRMIDASGVVLYVGKASNLKKRVSSYFTKQNTGSKTRSLINQIASIQISVTRSETEALLLESSLIKSLKPKYNVLLRDDKSYPYIHVSEGPFPRMEALRFKKKPKKGLFFGPYPSVFAVRETLSVIQKVFKIRGCAETYFSTRSRPCLQYQIKRCSAPCTQLITETSYRQSLKDAIRFLEGKSQDILDELGVRMDAAVAALQFEEAARLRDQIKSLRLVQEQQSVVQLRGDADVIAIEVKPGFACVQCVTIREGQILVSQKFFPSVPEKNFEEDENAYDLWQQVFSAFISHFYIDTPERIPALIITNHKVIDCHALEKMLSNLRGKTCKIQTNPRGVKARWFDFAQNNLQLAINEHRASTKLLHVRFEALSQLLGMERINRMECFDISHTQGAETVASCVVFDEKGPCKSQYRCFNIKGIKANDDYAATEQVLIRRFKRLKEMQNLPNLVIIDGGKGQVGVAKRVFNQLEINNIKLLGIAKGPTRKAGWEQLILADEEKELVLPPDNPALHLLQHIRDEAHRFAITFHRKKRQKVGIESSLESIEGVGGKRRQALLRRFGGIRELSRASIDEIAKVPGISESLASRIYEHFHAN
ncbi:excinuclease ABC subunit (plasmid) [Legionella adelaidensis]|uniref:UvrABC system protein C n=1 Tax=Legionella adelaidensis TaxID=45056 RepID=A0A0W0R2V4_9GAMM|nr:excinuclease ABC subunit UvrC [Legionella adelaidensis]KTC65407.1 excinuclease ABC subunit C [Legionella adelaidensis]VEH84771.1 excinuclease ABC subunit [Legionella adelaidensis]